MKVVSYLRVSTDRQDLENQRMEIENYTKKLGLSVDQWIQVEMSSRKSFEKREIDELLSTLKKGDTLVVSELSRLSRSIREIHNILHILMEKKIYLHIIKQNIITTPDGGNDISTKILITVLSMVGEMERDYISMRTKNGLDRVRKQGKKLGNPNIGTHVEKLKEQSQKFSEGLRTVITGLVNQGLTQREIVSELNKLNIKTRRGCNFEHITLQRVMKRLGIKTLKSLDSKEV
jgi:DNA invertase Pin-like site-specific DNA recombinase